MSTPVATGLTVADLARFPEDDGLVREIVGGELYVRGAAALRHQDAVLDVGLALRNHARRTGGHAWVTPGNVLSDRDAVIPDVVFVQAERLAGMDPGHVDRAADLVVEVTSPGTRSVDLGPKRYLYERVGVPEYWVVDLDAHVILVFRLRDGRYGDPLGHGLGDTIRPPHLPGLAVAVGDVLG